MDATNRTTKSSKARTLARYEKAVEKGTTAAGWQRLADALRAAMDLPGLTPEELRSLHDRAVDCAERRRRQHAIDLQVRRDADAIRYADSPYRFH
jgi:hypothetical protein